MLKTSEAKKKYWYIENIFIKLSTLRGSTSDKAGTYHSRAQSHHSDKTVSYIAQEAPTACARAQ